MMKQLLVKLLLVCLLVFPAILTFAQPGQLMYGMPVKEVNNKQEIEITPEKSAKSIFTEDFSSGTFPPDGWTINGDGQWNWSAWENSYAGGSAPECRFNWYPSFNGNSKLVSPVIATSGYTSMELDFQHFLDDFSGGYDLKIETTSDGGTTWNEAWTVTPTGDIGPEAVTVLIDNGDVGSDNFQFAITFDGYTNIDGWYLDNIILIDAQAATYNVTYNLKDIYDDPIEGAEINMEFNGTMTTDTSGQAVFADVIPGTFDYVITATDFVTDSGSVTVSDADVSIDVLMESAPVVLFSEDFTDGLCPPENWSVTPSGVGNWMIKNGNSAGGIAPEGTYDYFPVYQGTTRLITPVINTSAYATLELEFKHWLQGSSNSNYSFKVETTSDGGSTWNEAWSITPGGSFPAETLTIAIENSDVGSPNFQFCLTYVSTTFSAAYWYRFDDIVLTSTSFGSLVYPVTFNVKDEDENPIEGALVTMGDYATLSTDAAGQVFYNEVAEGTYTWDVYAGGAYVEQSGTVTVASDDVIVDVEMETFVPVFPFSEDFSNNAMPPAEWTIVGGGDENWITESSVNAGGTAPEAALTGTPNFIGNSKLVSPVLPSEGVLSLMLDFKHYVDDLSGSDYTCKVETTSDGGATWNEVWSVSPTGNIGPEDVSILIENDDVGSENFQFAFTFEGNTDQVNYWYFDDINLDVALLENLIMEEFPTGAPFPPEGWGFAGGGSANWGQSATTYAGGEANELYFAYGLPYFTGTSRFMTPTMSTYNYTSLKLQFNHYVSPNADYGFAYKVETSGDGGATWNEIWSITPPSIIDGEVVTLLIDNADVGSDDFKLALTFEGSSTQISYWYVDNIYLTDGAGSEVYDVTYTVTDVDNNPIAGAEVNVQQNGLKSTDGSGQVTFENVFPGTYNWDVSKYLFETETAELTVTDEPVIVDVTMGASLELLNESWEGAFPPLGWSTYGDGQNAWFKSVISTNAGGEAWPELYLNPESNPFSGNAKFVSPEIVTVGYSGLVLQMQHAVWDLTGEGYTLKVETTSDGGTTWNEAWSVAPTGDIEAQLLSVFIDTDDVGSALFQFAFTFEGNSIEIERWYIDDVVLSATLANDAGVVSTDVPELAITGTVIEPSAIVKNSGYELATFDVTLEILEGTTAVYSEVTTVTDLAPYDTLTVLYPSWTSIVGDYVVEISTNLMNDENPANDTLSQALGVASGLVPKKPFYEVFTSSTCGPCPIANGIIDGVLDNNPGAYSIIKYQMNWPGWGDPYYTPEGGVRRDYYEVASVPNLHINSVETPAASFTQAVFDEYAAEETALEIDIIEASIDADNIVTVSANLNSIVYYDAGLTAHIVVVEKLTTGNIGTNGETEFHYVMMKMMPNAEGTTLDALITGVPLTLTESFDMDETNMEEPDDLAVVVFVQNNMDKSIVQSAMLDITGNQFTYGNLEGTVTDADGGAAIEGATVMAGTNETTTDASGMFSFIDILTGTYTVTCTADGYNDSEPETVVVEDGQTATLDFALIEFIPPPVECNNFDDLTVGELVAEQLGGMWTTWSGTSTDDATVTDVQSNSGSNSFVVDAGAVDLIRLLAEEPISTGQWLYSNYIYVPTGFSGYFNVQTEPTPGVDWNLDLYFDDGGTGSFAGQSTETFTYAQDTWIFIEINYDLDVGYAWVKFDGVLVLEFENTLTIGGIDYYGSDTGGTPGAYFDDVCFIEGEEIIPLIPPTNLTGPDIVQYGEEIVLSWDAPVVDNKASKELTGYNVYRKHNVGTYSYLVYTTETTYTDIPDEPGMFTYQVTAYYDPEGESDPSNEHVVDIIDGISEHLNKVTQLYPNPATDFVNISSDYTMESITVYNFAGQIIHSESVNNTSYRVNTSEFQAGIYLFQIETEEGRIAKRIIIE